jgi:hypothetical protein
MIDAAMAEKHRFRMETIYLRPGANLIGRVYTSRMVLKFVYGFYGGVYDK